MIHKIYPSLNDFENLSRLKVESSDFANNFDYSNVVVNKPWGYEYLWFQNHAVAIWFLHIKEGQGTSLHCHAKKRTSLIVLDGQVECSTLDDKYKLDTLHTVVLEPCVFHSSKAVSSEGAFIMEIETPPMKGDLIRMHDAYGRQNSGYEKLKEYCTDFHLYEFHPFKEEHHSSWRFKGIEISLLKGEEIREKNAKMVVPVSGLISMLDKDYIDVGETVSAGKGIAGNILNIESCEFLSFNYSNN